MRCYFTINWLKPKTIRHGDRYLCLSEGKQGKTNQLNALLPGLSNQKIERSPTAQVDWLEIGVVKRPKSWPSFADECPLSTGATFARRGMTGGLSGGYLDAFFGLALMCSSRTRFLVYEPQWRGLQSGVNAQLSCGPRRCLFSLRFLYMQPSHQYAPQCQVGCIGI